MNTLTKYITLLYKKREKWKIRLKEQKADSLDKAHKALNIFLLLIMELNFLAPSYGPIINTVNTFTRSSVLIFCLLWVSQSLRIRMWMILKLKWNC